MIIWLNALVNKYNWKFWKIKSYTWRCKYIFLKRIIFYRWSCQMFAKIIKWIKLKYLKAMVLSRTFDEQLKKLGWNKINFGQTILTIQGIQIFPANYKSHSWWVWLNFDFFEILSYLQRKWLIPGKLLNCLLLF